MIENYHLNDADFLQLKAAAPVKPRRHLKGFTLIEMLVVIVIMGLLIGLIGPAVLGRADQAKVDTTRVQIRTLQNALDMYKLDNNFYPTTDQGLEALVSKPSGSPQPRNWNSAGYLSSKTLPKDGWERDYLYFSPGEEGPYDLISLGRDGTDGGEDLDADLSAWDEN